MVAVLNSGGGLYNPEGINPEHLNEFILNHPESKL